MIHIAILSAVFLSAFIESLRIKAVKGRWLNVPKWVTFTIGTVIFGMVFVIFKPTWPIPFEMLFIRAALYDPILNRFRGLKWDYVSVSTNSLLDKLEAKIGLHFAAQRIVYGVLAIIFLILSL